MKSLKDFKVLFEEETSDYSKFDMLARAGLVNKAQLQRVHKILDKMQQENPTFNSSDRAILQNLFNRMASLLTNNRQIFAQAKKAVREESELEEGEVVSSDYKLSDTGRKVRAHRKMIENTVLDEAKDTPEDPPFTLLLKRKAIRLYPNKTKIALYYNDKIGKYFSIPYGPEIDPASLQAEEYIEEAVIDQLHKIVNNKQTQIVRFGDGSSKPVSRNTASAITQVHSRLNSENKKKICRYGS